MAPKKKDSDSAFTNFTIKVNVDRSWEKTVEKVLKSVKVSQFRMENDGRVNIQGFINPNVLLECFRKAGKDAQIVHWQYGECSSNLYDKTAPSNYYGHGSSNYYYGDGYDYGYNNNGYHNNGYYANGYPGYVSNDAYNSHTEKPRRSSGHDTGCGIM
uniref:uncharacterized protein LOC122586170 n=1 Tax=Erigeron canadensis TaxID=72917 RepID=UPI001CB91E88|nr:uncharacterized protein LOC122586170 [Erigeron canadensis]